MAFVAEDSPSPTLSFFMLCITKEEVQQKGVLIRKQGGRESKWAMTKLSLVMIGRKKPKYTSKPFFFPYYSCLLVSMGAGSRIAPFAPKGNKIQECSKMP